jgi:hypothetical protein
MGSTPRHARARRRSGWAAPLIVGLVAFGVLLVAAAHSLRVTSQISTRSLEAADRTSIDRESCLRAEVRQQVPKGASVYIDATGIDRQYFVQYLAAWASPVKSRTRSTIMVSLAPATTGGCAGQMIETSSP